MVWTAGPTRIYRWNTWWSWRDNTPGRGITLNVFFFFFLFFFFFFFSDFSCFLLILKYLLKKKKKNNSNNNNTHTKQNDVTLVVSTESTNWVVTKPCINKNWKLENWNEKRWKLEGQFFIFGYFLYLTLRTSFPLSLPLSKIYFLLKTLKQIFPEKFFSLICNWTSLSGDSSQQSAAKSTLKVRYLFSYIW